MIKPVHALVVTPHPDDAEFGVGGNVAGWTRQGKDVVYVVATNGDKGTSDYSVKPEELVKTREQEQLEAARTLGVREVVFLRHPDQSLEDTPEFRKELVRLIRMYRPEIVVTADPYRRYIWHRDHRITARVTLDAVFPYARDHLAYPELLEEGLKPHKVKEVLLWGSEDINYRTDITDTIDLKITALGCHKSQLNNDSSTGYEEWIRRWARERAQGEDYEFAEVFHREEIRR